jgi:hypothetical protein
MGIKTMVCQHNEACQHNHNEEFGKDHGLIHEAVVTGRKVGAGREFWTKIASWMKRFSAKS